MRKRKNEQFAQISKLHELLKVALDDLALVELNDSKYTVNMAHWHLPSLVNPNKCNVCLAGAVIAGSLGCLPEEPVFPSDWEESVANKLLALDYLRTGQVAYAALQIGVSYSSNVDLNRKITDYQTNKETWWQQIRQLQKDLEKANV